MRGSKDVSCNFGTTGVIKRVWVWSAEIGFGFRFRFRFGLGLTKVVIFKSYALSNLRLIKFTTYQIKVNQFFAELAKALYFTA